MTMIDKAERVSRARAVIFYMMTVVLVLSVVVAGNAEQRPILLLPWLCMIAASLANLWTVGFARSRALKAMLNDEGTRAHRQMAMTAGFVAAMISGAVVTVTAAFTPFGAMLAGKVVLTAALVAALGCFATLELWASR